MTDQLKLMAILAHPDDETMGAGGTLVKYAGEGIKTYLVTATKGEKGRFRREKEPPGPEIVGQVREKELSAAADAGFQTEDDHQPHAISKLYYMTWSKSKWEFMESFVKESIPTVDGVKRNIQPWPDWQITTRIDAGPYWKTVWKAVQCHETQITLYEQLMDLPEKDHETLWGSQEYYRVFSTVNGGRETEDDLFEGLR